MKKLTSVDYLRAFSMLYIVAYWHSLGYANVAFGQNNDIMWTVTNTIMALFVFISGFLVGGPRSRELGATRFYKRRFLRIYPLYLFAVALYYVAGIQDGGTLLKSLVGLSMYLEPPPITLWFITMLLLFYLITPLLLALVSRLALFLSFIAGLILLSLILEVTAGSVDLRVVRYLPAFCLGVYCANHDISNRLINPRVALMALPVAAVLTTTVLPLQTIDFLKTAPLITLAAYLIFFACYRYDGLFKPSGLVAFLSYSSFAMYLFHRPLFEAMQTLYFPASTWLQIVYLTTVCVLVIALVSWGFQKMYDWTYQLVSRPQATQKATT